MSDEKKPQADFIQVEGIVELVSNQCAQLMSLQNNGKLTYKDPFVSRELVRRFKLKRGSYVVAKAAHDPRHPNAKVRFIETVDGLSLEDRKRRLQFAQLTTVTPDEQLKLEVKDERMTTRVMDLFCPVGKGQRGLIVAPPRTGKTTLLQDFNSSLPPQ